MRFRPASLVTAFFVLFFGFALFEARNFPSQPQIYPVLTASTGIIFTLLALWRELRGKINDVGQEGIMDLAPDRTTPPAIVRRRALRILSWILGLYLGIWVLGFKLAIFLFFVLFLRLEGRANWLLTAILTAFSVYLMVFQFERLLSVFWPTGLLEQWLGEALPFLF